MTIDETKDYNSAEKLEDYKDKLDENVSDQKYIYTESDFEGFIMDNYLPHQIDELPNNKREE